MKLNEAKLSCLIIHLQIELHLSHTNGTNGSSNSLHIGMSCLNIRLYKKYLGFLNLHIENILKHLDFSFVHPVFLTSFKE